MIAIRIISPNSLDQSLRQDVVDVRCVWATCSSCVPAQKDIRYGVNIALVKIWTRDKIKPKHVQQEFKRACLRHFMNRLPHTFLIAWPSAETVVDQNYFPYMSFLKPEIRHFLVVSRKSWKHQHIAKSTSVLTWRQTGIRSMFHCRIWKKETINDKGTRHIVTSQNFTQKVIFYKVGVPRSLFGNTSCIQLFRGRLSEKLCTRQSRNVIWDMINALFLTL